MYSEAHATADQPANRPHPLRAQDASRPPTEVSA
jgi:hypothetical protein